LGATLVLFPGTSESNESKYSRTSILSDVDRVASILYIDKISFLLLLCLIDEFGGVGTVMDIVIVSVLFY
jgi:hypothetical protein